MTDTRGRRASFAWFRREPYPSVVRVLLDHELLAEGGTASLRLATRLVEAHDEGDAMGGRATEQIIAQLWIENIHGALATQPDTSQQAAAAQAIVDVLVEHRAPT